MKITFYKYQATGNDFVIINHFYERFWTKPDKESIARLCHRRFGIGADGLMFIEPSNLADFKMVYYNSDGAESTMCGNGGRCIAHLAHKLGIIGHKGTFEAVDGLHEVVIGEAEVSLGMIDVENFDILDDYMTINTGSPHYLRFVSDIQHIAVKEEGARVRYNKLFEPSGINVNFIQIDGDKLTVRTYERGVEDETYSCGTGVTAAAMGYILRQGNVEGSYKQAISTIGGELAVQVDFINDRFTNVQLIGPAVCTFTGILEL